MTLAIALTAMLGAGPEMAFPVCLERAPLRQLRQKRWQTWHNTLHPDCILLLNGSPCEFEDLHEKDHEHVETCWEATGLTVLASYKERKP